MCIIHYSFLESNQSITAEVYCQQLDDMHIKLSKMGPALVNQQGTILLWQYLATCCEDDTAETH